MTTKHSLEIYCTQDIPIDNHERTMIPKIHNIADAATCAQQRLFDPQVHRNWEVRALNIFYQLFTEMIGIDYHLLCPACPKIGNQPIQQRSILHRNQNLRPTQCQGPETRCQTGSQNHRLKRFHLSPKIGERMLQPHRSSHSHARIEVGCLNLITGQTAAYIS